MKRQSRSGAAQGRREVIWAWASLATLVVCWDRSARLDEPVSPPRIRVAHGVDREASALGAGSFRVLSE
ncbi:MAG: hypothetical protein ACREV5_03080 [Steroidobacter sp.]